MIFAHGGVQGDVSTKRLPADAVPAVFAYSLNRKLRKLYSGEYFRYRQASGGEFDYPSNTPNLAEDVFIVKIYDQKSMHGIDVQDAVQPTESLQPKLKLKTVETIEVLQPFNYGGYNFTTGERFLVVGYNAEGTRPYINHPNGISSSSRLLLRRDTRGVDWKLNTYNYYEAEFDQVEYLDIAKPIGSAFSNDIIGAKIVLLPNSGLMNLSAATVTIGKPYTIVTVSTNLNRIGFFDDNPVQPMFWWVDDETRAFGRQRGVDWKFTSMAGEIGQDFTITTIGDGGDFPRPMISLWGTADRITVEPSDQATRFTFNNNLGTILDQDGKVTQCISGYDPKQNNHRALTVKTGGAHGHITTTSQTPTFSNISIGREDQRLYKGTFSEATMHLGNLTELGSEQLFQTTRTYYGD